MMQRDTLLQDLNNYLKSVQFADYAPNGLQVEGKAAVRRVCTAVTASLEIIELAIALQADVLLVHHGFFWRGESSIISGMKRKRLSRLLAHDINLIAYHLPLDVHPLIGNNACIGKLLQADQIVQHAHEKIDGLIWSGHLQAPQSAETFSKTLTNLFQQTPIHLSGGKNPIAKVAWCSGAAQDFIVQAAALGMDAYISGEVSERTYYLAKELGIHYFACGHHATERFGIQALGTYLQSQYGLEVQFIDVDNPI